MQIAKILSSPKKLEEYSFLWSQARLVVGAVALFLGGVPVLRALVPSMALSGLVKTLLTLSWLISGVAAGYLLYQWNKTGKKVFGGNDQKDTIAFFVSVVSGLNLGVTGLFGSNPGMSILSGQVVFIVVGLAYLVSAYHLQMRWKATGKKIF